MHEKCDRDQRSIRTRKASAAFTSKPFAFAEEVRERLGVTREQMAELIGLHPRTYRRRARTGCLNGAESIMVGMLDVLLAQAERVLGGQEEAREWLTSPILSLDGKRPVELIVSLSGYERVRNKLLGIEYGTY